MPAPTKKRRTRLGADLRQEQILEEATRIIGQNGYHGFSIQELAERCRITNAGLLYYFGSKEQLMVALLQYRVSRDTAALSWLFGETKPREQVSLSTIIKSQRAIVERNISQPEIVRFWAVVRAEALNRGHPAREFFIERETETIRRWTRLLAPHVPQSESAARQVFAFMVGLEEQWLREERGFDMLKEWDRGVAKLLPVK